jgi:dTDP-4-dehydrorhamnose reductase
MVDRLRELALRDLPGIYHMANSGEGTSYAGFARAIAAQLDIEEVPADSLHRPAPRPKNSRLACVLQNALGFDPLPDWRDAVQEFVTSHEATVPHSA